MAPIRNMARNRNGKACPDSVVRRGSLRTIELITADAAPFRQPGHSMVRREKIARGRLLLRDSAYPSNAALESVAGLLARALGPDVRSK